MSDSEALRADPEASLLALPQPICVVTKCDALSVAAAAMLIGTFFSENLRCCVRVVPQYTKAELPALLCEDYPSFIFLDCTEQAYIEAFAQRHAYFFSSENAYKRARASSPSAGHYAYLLVAGCVGRYLESGGQFFFFDAPLEDALKHGQLVSDLPVNFVELTDQFFSGLRVHVEGVQQKLFDFSEMLNACVRVGKAALLVSALLGSAPARDEVIRVLGDYRRDIGDALEWYEHHKSDSERVVIGRGHLIVNMKDYIAPHVAGSLAARLALRKQLEEKTFVLVLVYIPDDKIRVSLRMVGTRDDVDLARFLGTIFEGISSEHGGTPSAAGGVFARADEERFLSNAKKMLEQKFFEESVDAGEEKST